MSGCSKLRFLLALCLALLSACRIRPQPPAAINYFYLNPDKDLTTVGRAVVVGLENESEYPQIADQVTKALFESVQKQQLFGLTLVSQNHPQWRSLMLKSDAQFSLEQMFAIRKYLGTDAILSGTITTYRPYPNMAVGLRLRLLDLRDGQLLWALEQIWDTTDKTTEAPIKKYFKHVIRADFEPLREKLLLLSSIRFTDFVAYEVAQTLTRGK